MFTRKNTIWKIQYKCVCNINTYKLRKNIWRNPFKRWQLIQFLNKRFIDINILFPQELWWNNYWKNRKSIKKWKQPPNHTFILFQILENEFTKMDLSYEERWQSRYNAPRKLYLIVEWQHLQKGPYAQPKLNSRNEKGRNKQPEISFVLIC